MISLKIASRTWGAPLLVGLAAGNVVAQSAPPGFDEHMALGMVAADTRDPAGAVEHFAAALALDSTDYQANWRMASALIDVGKQTPDDVKNKERDSLYVLAEVYARRAVDAELLQPDGHYILAAAIGRASLTKGNKERVRRAREIRVEALKALELDPEHDNAHHVVGQWNAEIKRLSGVQRWFAKNMYGGDFLDLASWQQAEEHMQLAVAINPAVIYHRMVLAEIYIDLKRYGDARPQLQAIDSLPVFDVLDPRYKTQAGELTNEMAGKEDGRD
jgi:tetratricopeptide (TPR) repeat protein